MSSQVLGFKAPRFEEPEPFVDAERAAKHLCMKDPRTILRWAREGKIPAHPLPVGNTQRNRWLFKLSELDKWMMGEIDSQGRPYPGKATKCA